MPLQHLALSSNYLSSTLPLSWGSATSSLDTLSMGDNLIKGSHPALRTCADWRFRRQKG